MYTLDWIGEKQHKKLMEYLSLLKTDDIADPREMSSEEFEREILRLLNILEAFGNCPKKAAAAFYSAKANAGKAMDKVYELMLAHIPKPTHKHFYEAFATIEEADAYRAKVKEEAGKAYSEVLAREFHDIYFNYKWEELEKPQTLH